MKKKISRMTAVIISAILCLTATVSAFAAPPSAPPDGGGGFGGGGGADTMTYDYSGTLSATLTADGEKASANGETLSSTQSDANTALAQNGGVLDIQTSVLNKSGSDEDGDNCNFYGINSILLSVGEGSTAYIGDSDLNADSTGSNAIFATDSGTVYSYNNTIKTSADNSRGLDATYGGTIIADMTTISTQGDHCAATATDRGGGSVSVTNSSFTTAGSGSPLIYSTGDIEVDNVTGTATGSQIAGMEGLNTVLIYNSDLTSEITGKTASDPIANGIIIYQSTSGDAESTTGEAATFNAVNSNLTSAIESGSMFYITNTTANVVLSNTVLDYDYDSAALLTVEGNSSNNWGTEGSNGATVTFTAMEENLAGDISVDTISSLDFYVISNSTYTGAASITDNSAAASTSESPITMNIDASSKWVVTGDSTVTNLNLADGGEIIDEDGNTVTVVANGETVIEGDSDYTVTVTGAYSTEVTTSEANLLSTDFIDRTDFDSYYNVSTAFGTNADNDLEAETTTIPVSLSTGAAKDRDSKSYILYIVLGAAAAAIVVFGAVTVSRKNSKSRE